MALTRYRTAKGVSKIYQVKIDKETKPSVWVNGKRRATFSMWDKYHETWGAAQRHLIHRATYKVNLCKTRLGMAREELKEAKALTYSCDG